MTQHYLDLHVTGQFPRLLLDYLSKKPELEDFYSVYPSLENVSQVIKRREEFPESKRKQLVAALEKQYASIPSPPDFSGLLNERTFTVTTGHQLNIFGGPLYIIYKIITTINLARLLKLTYPGYDFVPVYWMATEDHDFEEIASVHLFGKTFTWQTAQGGAVGRLHPGTLAGILSRLPEPVPLFDRAYLQNATLADAVRQYMHELFGKAGLICLDPDDASLKASFLPVISSELTSQPSAAIVRNTTDRLEALGYETPVNAREINLFYLRDGLRERIVTAEEGYQILRVDKMMSREEILEEAAKHPERFSPNVVLRPLYQETILPNLAYIGGPSEIPYWMQLKGVFDFYETPFPWLVPRNFALFVTAAEQRRMKKLGLCYPDIFGEREALRKKLIAANAPNEWSLAEERDKLDHIFGSVYAKAGAIDTTMEAAVLAEKTRWLKSFLKLEKRLYRAEERRHGVILGQLQNVLDSFYPCGVPQERYSNFLEFQSQNSRFIAELFRCFDPLDFRFNILEEAG